MSYIFLKAFHRWWRLLEDRKPHRNSLKKQYLLPASPSAAWLRSCWHRQDPQRLVTQHWYAWHCGPCHSLLLELLAPLDIVRGEIKITKGTSIQFSLTPTFWGCWCVIHSGSKYLFMLLLGLDPPTGLAESLEKWTKVSTLPVHPTWFLLGWD
jgi:hypothetical protein